MTGDAVFAPAKINLTLHVTGQRQDGYHLLDSLVMFADIGDRLRFEKGPDLRVEVSGPFAAGVPTDQRNLVWQAAELAAWTGCIYLEKNLPHGGGVGGGSADAAAVLRTLGGGEHAADLGADVPVCLTPIPQRMRGIGEQLETLEGLPALHAVLINPGNHAATPAVFKALTTKNNPVMPDRVPAFGNSRDFITWLKDMRNDLEEPAARQIPTIADVLQAMTLEETCCLARMSGSGATCVALFQARSHAEAAAQRLAKKHPDWWVRACVLS